MKVKEIIEILEKARPEADIFISGLKKDHKNRSLQIVGTIEHFGNYVVIVGDQ